MWQAGQSCETEAATEGYTGSELKALLHAVLQHVRRTLDQMDDVVADV